tara:strand:+ start:201 stop:440 length:240 start_codon:yes stop_codon:yes gene_type:complete
MYGVVLMPKLPKDTGYTGDMPTSITSMRNMKSHLIRKMRMDELHPDNVTDDEMTNFLISCFGFSREFCARAVEEWRDEL